MAWPGLAVGAEACLPASSGRCCLPPVPAELPLHQAFLCGPMLLHCSAHLQAVPALHRDRLPGCHALREPADVQQRGAGTAWGKGRPALLPAEGLLG